MDARHYKYERIAKLRNQAGISQQELGLALGVHKMTISRAENGGHISYDLLAKIATYFRVPVTGLLSESQKAVA